MSIDELREAARFCAAPLHEIAVACGGILCYTENTGRDPLHLRGCGPRAIGAVQAYALRRMGFTMIRRLFRQMLWPQVLSAMTVMLCMLVDSMMIGRFLGDDAITAYGFTMPILLVFAALGSMLSAGVQVVCGKAMGSGDRDRTDACFTASALLALLIAGVGLALVLLFAEPLCTLLGAGQPGADNPVFDLTKAYLIGFILGAPGFIIAQLMVPYMQLAARRTRLVVAVAVMTVSDILFDWLNVFVFHGGTFGMGLASSISYYLALLIGIGYFFKKDCLFRLRFRRGLFRMCGAILRHGVPTVVNQISMVLLTLLLNRLLREVGGYGAVAAYSVTSTIGNICFAFGTGIGAVALMLSAALYADEDRSGLVTLVKTMLRYAVLLALPVTLAAYFGAPYLVKLFLSDTTAAEEMTVLGTRLFVLCLVPSAINSALKNYYQGISRVRLTQIISVLQNFFMPALFALALSPFHGTTGVWLCFVCGEAATLLILSIIVWTRHGGVSLYAKAYALLPDTLGTAPEDTQEWTILTEWDAIKASEQAELFCLRRGESQRDSAAVATCVREMASNIVRHGFSADRKRHSLTVRVSRKNRERIIRLRDNCEHFDPVHYYEEHKTPDSGIGTVMSLVKDADYINALGLNNLTLRL